ncbi:hypothetical protein [Pradoshia sp.]
MKFEDQARSIAEPLAFRVEEGFSLLVYACVSASRRSRVYFSSIPLVIHNGEQNNQFY